MAFDLNNILSVSSDILRKTKPPMPTTAEPGLRRVDMTRPTGPQLPLDLSPPPTDFQRQEMAYDPLQEAQRTAAQDVVPPGYHQPYIGFPLYQQRDPRLDAALQFLANIDAPSPLHAPGTATSGLGWDFIPRELAAPATLLAAGIGKIPTPLSFNAYNPLTDPGRYFRPGGITDIVRGEAPSVPIVPGLELQTGKPKPVEEQNAVTQFVAQSLPYILAPQAAGNALFAATLPATLNDQVQAYRDGQISKTQLVKNLTMTLGPMIAPELARLGVKGVGGAIRYGRTPEGQKLVGDALTAIKQGEGGGGRPLDPFGEPVKPGEVPPLPATAAVPEPGAVAPATVPGEIPTGARQAEAVPPLEARPVEPAIPPDVGVSRASGGGTAPAVGDLAPGEGRVTFGTGEERQPVVQGMTDKAVPKVRAGVDLTGAQLSRDAALYEKAFGEKEPPALPAPVQQVTVDRYLPERQQFLDQVTAAQEAVDAAAQRASEVRGAYKSQAPRRRAVGAASAKGMTETPEGMLSKNEIVRAHQEVTTARQNVRAAKQALKEADVRVTIDDIEQRARESAKALGYNPDDPTFASQLATIRQTIQTAESTIPATDPLLDAANWQKRLAGAIARVKGTQPGVVGTIGETQGILRRALDEATMPAAQDVGKALDREIGKAKLTYTGPAALKDAALSHPDIAVTMHPDWFNGITPGLRVAITDSQRAMNPGYQIIRAFDPKAAAEVPGNYLPVMWEFGGPSTLAPSTARWPSGRAGMAKARTWHDPFVALGSKNWPYELKPMSAGELVQRSVQMQNQYIADLSQRKLILERFGRKVAQGKASGYVRATDPLYAGWWLPKDVNAMVTAMREPAPAPVRAVQPVATAFKDTVFGVGDFAVFGTHVLQGTIANGTKALMAMVNRSLEAAHLPHMTVYYSEEVPRSVQRVMDGVQQGTAGASVQLKGGTLVKYIPKVGETVDRPITAAVDALSRVQFGGILTPFRNLTYEGNLMLARVLGEDATSAAVRRAAADNANTWTGASRGAVNVGRRTAESTTLTSYQITRAMAAQLGEVAKLVRPDTVQGKLAMASLVNFAALVYGVGSAINMTYGDGKPVEFDPRSSDWANIHVGGRVVSLVPQKSLVRALGKSVLDIQKEDPEALTAAWAQFAYSRLNPGAQLPALAAGYGFDPNKGFQTGNLSAKQRIIQALPLPPVAQQATEGDRGPLALGLNVAGLNTYPQSEYEQQQARSAAYAALDRAPDAGKAFRSQGWREYFAANGFSNVDLSNYDSLNELRQAYIDHHAGSMVKSQNISQPVAEQLAGAAFDRLAPVKHFAAQYGKARLAFWREHPDLLVQAADAGVEELNKDERRIYEQYKAGQAVTVGP